MRTSEQRWSQVQPDETRARAATELTRVFVLMTRYKDRLDDPGLRPAGSRPVRLFLMNYPLPEDEA